MTIFLIVTIGFIAKKPFDFLKAEACLLTVFGGLLISIFGRRLIVDQDGITIISWFVVEKNIKFSDFSIALPCVLVEPDHPISLSLLKDDGTQIANIRLKIFPQHDVQWLLSLPEMKVQHRIG